MNHTNDLQFELKSLLTNKRDFNYNFHMTEVQSQILYTTQDL